MSVKVSSWVWHEARYGDGTAIVGNELVFMLALADVADDNGRCRFVDDESDLTYAALGEKARVSKSTVIRMVASLREGGLIEHGKGVKGRPNEFRVVVPWSANPERGPADSVSSDADSVSTTTVFGVNSDTRTSLKRIDVSDVSTSATPAKPETTGQRYAQPLCDVLATELQRNEVKYTISKRWLDAARLMVDADGRDPHEAKALIEWACRDSFWRANVHSMPTFREQYDKLRLKRGAGTKGTVAGGQVAAGILRDRRAAREQKSVAS